jgi:uncharacterized membrane protein YczE
MQSAAASAPVPLTAAHPASRSRLVSWARLFAGLWVFAAGLALMVRANLGLSSWDVLHDALAGVAPVTFGGAIVAVSVVVVAVSALLGVLPGPATVANMLLVGTFTDVLLASGALRGLEAGPLGARAVVLLAGVAAIALGTGLYIGAGLGAGPRDSLMLALSERFGTSPGRARSVIELSVLAAGVAAGGRAGLGTVAFALLIGPAIDVAFRLVGRGRR